MPVVTYTLELESAVAAELFHKVALYHGKPEYVANPDYDPDLPLIASNPQLIANPQSDEEFVREKFLLWLQFAYQGQLERERVTQATTEAQEAIQADVAQVFAGIQ